MTFLSSSPPIPARQSGLTPTAGLSDGRPFVPSRHLGTTAPRVAPAVADAASATIMRRAGELLRVLAKHLFDGSDPGRQTEALKGAVHILPSRLEAGHERER